MENNRKTSGNHRRKKGSRNHGIAMYPTLAVRWIKKNKAMSAALAVLLIVVAGTGVLVGWGMGRGKAQKDAGETQASAETIPERPEKSRIARCLLCWKMNIRRSMI